MKIVKIKDLENLQEWVDVVVEFVEVMCGDIVFELIFDEVWVFCDCYCVFQFDLF